MPPAFDLDETIEPGPGTGPRRFLRLVLLMAVRDGADHVFLGPDPSPGVLGVLVQYRVADKLYDLIPPPYRHVRLIAEGLRPFLSRWLGGGDSGWGGWFVVRLGDQLLSAWAAVRDTEPVAQIALGLPLRPDLATEAGRLLRAVTDDAGLVEFADAEFE